MNPRTGMVFGRIYYGWVVVAVSFLAIVVSAGVRAAPQALIHPLEQEFGWDRASIALAVSTSLLFYGISGPIAGRLLDKYGPRGVMMGFLSMTGAGILATAFMQSLWQFNLVWGVVVGLGTGGMVGALSASLAARWFTRNRGLVIGILTAASSTGQAAIIPIIIAAMAVIGWRGSLIALATILGLIILPSIWLFVKNDPADAGIDPVAPLPGASGAVPVPAPPQPHTSLTQAMRTPGFWTFCVIYTICGVTDSGMIGTHLLAHSIDRGIPEMTAAIAVAVMGIMNLFGTTFSGWCSDRFDHRKILAVVFTFRTVSLAVLPFVNDLSGLLLFAVFYGLSWIATGPPTASYLTDRYGRRSLGTIFGTIWLAHQIGSAGSAYLSGVVRVQTGDYTLAFLTGAGLTVVAALLSLRLASSRGAGPAGTTELAEGRGMMPFDGDQENQRAPTTG
ncbi:MAG: MFS transporter [Dehalococcoidia bacterium]|nr:MFS transporter [Dehalococcoidia bacterium]